MNVTNKYWTFHWTNKLNFLSSFWCYQARHPAIFFFSVAGRCQVDQPLHELGWSGPVSGVCVCVFFLFRGLSFLSSLNEAEKAKLPKNTRRYRDDGAQTHFFWLLAGGSLKNARNSPLFLPWMALNAPLQKKWEISFSDTKNLKGFWAGGLQPAASSGSGNCLLSLMKEAEQGRC